jgi:hypothetical protein
MKLPADEGIVGEDILHAGAQMRYVVLLVWVVN